MSLIRKAIQGASDEFVDIGDTFRIYHAELDEFIVIRQSDEKAFILVKADGPKQGYVPSVEQLLFKLKKEGVVYGVIVCW